MRPPVFEQGLLKVVELAARCHSCGEIRDGVVLSGPQGRVILCYECTGLVATQCAATDQATARNPLRRFP